MGGAYMPRRACRRDRRERYQGRPPIIMSRDMLAMPRGQGRRSPTWYRVCWRTAHAVGVPSRRAVRGDANRGPDATPAAAAGRGEDVAPLRRQQARRVPMIGAMAATWATRASPLSERLAPPCVKRVAAPRAATRAAPTRTLRRHARNRYSTACSYACSPCRVASSPFCSSTSLVLTRTTLLMSQSMP